MRAVADAAGVSPATVSRALQTPELLAPDTLKRVRETIARLGYVPNLQARNLRTSRSRLIVALVPDISNPFFSQIIRGIEQVAQQNGYAVLLGDTQADAARERTYADLVSARQADGIITLLPRVPDVRVPGRKPVVGACEYVDDPTVSSVQIDNVAAASAAVDHLLDFGHRHVAFIKGPVSSFLSEDRHQGYRRALRTRGIEPDSRLLAHGDFSVESGVAATHGLLAQSPRPTAIFCCNDEMAFGAIVAVRAVGLSVPRDISVVGFDDIHMARYYDPPLTTVAQPMREVGQEAMSMLLEVLTAPATPPRKRLLPTQLLVRGSSAPCRPGS
jgi:LacI family repressor for deo operon, udp, cdd, tsx, nupC, and nupG